MYLARRLGADGYGVIALATAILLYFNYLTVCGLDMLGVREVAHDRGGVATLVPSVLAVRLLVAAVLIVALVTVGLVAFPQPEGAVLAAYAFTLIPVALGTRWVLLGLERPGVAAVARTASEATSAVLIVALVRATGDVGRVPLAQVVGEGLGALVLLRALGEVAWLRVELRPAVVVPVLRRSWPLAAHALLGLLIFNCDLFFLRIYRDRATVGYYAAAYTLVSFFLNLGVSYGMSLLPIITRQRADPKGERDLYGSAMAHVFAAGFPIALGGGLLAAGIITFVFGARYQPAAAPLGALIWSIPVSLFRNVAQSALVARGRQDQVLRASAWAAALNVALNALIIPRWGMTGAALATVATEAVRTFLAIGFARGAGLPLTRPRRFWRTLVAGAAMAAVVVLARTSAVWLAVAGGVAAYGLAMLLVGGVRLRRGALPELTV